MIDPSRSKARALIAAFLFVVTGTAASAASPVRYAVAGSILGPDGGWDYAKVDSSAGRLYVARSDAVTVIDLRGETALASYGPVARGHAVVPLDGGRLLVTSGNDASARFFDTADGRRIASLPVGKKPDAAIYDAATHRAFVMNATDGTISVIDTAAMTVTKTIRAKPALEYAALAKDGTLFVNDEDLNEVEVIDVAQGKLVGSIAMPGCDGPTGLGYDEKGDRLISVCANGKAVLIDAAQRKVSGSIDIGRGADAIMVDQARQLAFVPCGKDGVLDILSLDGPIATRFARVTTEPGARTGALDATTGIVYLPTARFGPPAQAGGRPSIIPGSFHVLIVRPSPDTPRSKF